MLNPLPERIANMPDRVCVVADGRAGRVELVYYDRLHTGNSYDELLVKLDDGSCVRGAANLFAAEPSTVL